MADNNEVLLKTPLHALHVELDAKMVPFSGYDMPVQYPAGILKEHLHTREKAGLFDVSHMGQAFLSGADPAKALERLTPADVTGLKEGTQRYGLLLTETGTIKDDFMFSRLDRRGRPLSRRQRRHQEWRFRLYCRKAEGYCDAGAPA